jgi:two-component system, NarL family, nitrate/nitrite response regulator NarL
MDDQRTTNAWQLFALGVDEHLAHALDGLCERVHGIRFEGVNGSMTTLLFAMEESKPELVVLDEQALGEDSSAALSRIHDASPCTRLLIVGDAANAEIHWDVLRFGVAGYLQRSQARAQIPRAVAAMRRGEFWLSRSQSSQLLTRLSTTDDVRAHDKFRDLAVLTAQENRVLEQCLIGQSNKEIARVLSISEQTVKIHLQHVFRKLGVRRRADLLLRRWVGGNGAADTARSDR